MKKKYVLPIIIITLYVNQYAYPQSCPNGKVWACRYCGSNGLPECKCVDEKNVTNWQSHVHPCRFPQIASELDSSSQSVAFEVSHNIIPNSTETSLFLWQEENNSEGLTNIKKGEAILINTSKGGCACSIVGYGCRDYDTKCRLHCFSVCRKK